MTSPFWHSIFDLAKTTTTHVGNGLLNDFTQVQAAVKSDGSLVTQADRWADAEIRQAIATAFPDHGLLTEETQLVFPGTEWCWVVDPLDGTNNFARGIPIWGISLGLLYRGTPVFGYLHMPPIRQSFHAYLSHPELPEMPPAAAWMNGQPIHPTLDDPSRHHFFSACSRSWAWVGEIPCKRRMLGAAAYNLVSVALGSMVGAIEATPKVWDIAAAWTIVKASGAVWENLDNQPVFPLEAGADYSDRASAVLVLSRPDLLPLFRPAIAMS
jgi:myo-inositol-1(or 4)-monophosphatase